VPFCRVRCGYCDFNTYIATELRGVSQSDYAGQAVAEVELARRVLAASRDGCPSRSDRVLRRRHSHIASAR